MATQQQVAQHVGISDRQVRNLVRQGVFAPGTKGLDLDQCRVAYIKYLRQAQAPRGMDSDPTEKKAAYEAGFKEILGKQYLPGIWSVLLAGGTGLLTSEAGLSKTAAVGAVLGLIHLIHYRTEEFFRGEPVDVEYSELLIELAKAEAAGTLEQCVRKHWPD